VALGERGQARPLTGARWVAEASWHRAQEAVGGALARFADEHPVRWGRAKGDLKSALAREIEAVLFDAVLASGVRDGVFEARGDQVRAPGRGELTATDRAKRDRVLAALEAEGFSVPELSKLPAASGVPEAAEFVQRLLFEGDLVRIGQDFALTDGQWTQVRAALRTHFDTQAALQVADLKSLLGISRKHAIPLLECTDRVGFTLRVGDQRQRGPHL